MQIIHLSEAMWRLPSNPYLGREWPQYVVGPDMTRYSEPPPGAGIGVYFLFNADALTYVGQSTSITHRVGQHRRGGRPFTAMGFVNVPGDLVLAMEIAYIHALAPPGNAFFEPPPFMQHDWIVEAITERWGIVPQPPATPGEPSGPNAEQAAV